MTRLSDVGGNWVLGEVDGFAVQAKVYTEGSHYGVPQDDRVSKLFIKDSHGRTVFSWDRGPSADMDDISPDILGRIVTAVVTRGR